MISDDWSTLFGRSTPGVQFRQGTVTAWDANTGENTIDMGGGTLTDVPILNTGEAVALKAGHVVGLLGQGRVWFILGRVTLPNEPNFAAASVAFASAGSQAFNFTIPATLTLRASDTITVPEWADEAIVHVTGFGCFVNRTASPVLATMAVGVDGGGGGGAFQGFAPAGDLGWQDQQSVSASSRNHFTGLSGGETLTVEAKVQGSASLGVADGNNSIFVHAIALFKSNV